MTLTVSAVYGVEVDLSESGVVARSLESPEQFRSWLTRMPSNGIVGVRESLFSCPLANFLRSRGVEVPSVGPYTVRWGAFDRVAPEHTLPGWACQFVEAIDRTPAIHPEISATRALTLLHEVTREVAE